MPIVPASTSGWRLGNLVKGTDMSDANRSGFNDIEFGLIWQAIRTGDKDAEVTAIEKVAPQMLAALQRSFGSTNRIEPSDAVQSAIRTVLRREWNLAAEPRTWNELSGLLVKYAYNKARTMTRRPGPGQIGELDLCDSDDTLENVYERELIDAFACELESTELTDKTIVCGKLDGSTFWAITENLQAQGIFKTEAWVAARWKRHIVPRLRNRFEGLE